MSTFEIIDIALSVLCALAVGAVFYYRTKGGILEAVNELIAMAEQTGLTGPEKMDQVVTAICAKFRFPEETVRRIAQKVFNAVRKYAVAYMQTAGKGKEEREEALSEAFAKLNAETLAEIVSELMDLSEAAIVSKAKEYGILITETSDKKEIIREFVAALLEKA